MLDQQVEVPHHELQPLSIGRTAAGIAGPFPSLQLTEKPRVEQGAAANGDAVTACYCKHAAYVVESADVAVADDGNATHCLDRTPDAIEIDRPAEALSPRSAVQRDRR